MQKRNEFDGNREMESPIKIAKERKAERKVQNEITCDIVDSFIIIGSREYVRQYFRRLTMYAQIRNISIACIVLVALGGSFQTATADTEANKALVQRMIDEVMNQQNIDVIDELFAADYLMHDPAWPMEVKGPEGFRQWAGMMLDPYFSDSRITIEDMIAEGGQGSGPLDMGGHTHG